MNLNKYLADADTVSNLDSPNKRVADNLNRIYHALDLRIGPILIMGEERHWDPKLYDEMMSHVQGDWMKRWLSRFMLLHLTDEQIEEYVESKAAIHHIPQVPPPVVDNVEILQAQERSPTSNHQSRTERSLIKHPRWFRGLLSWRPARASRAV